MLHSDTLLIDPPADAAGSSTDKVQLFVDSWQGKAGRGTVLVILHGLGEHGGRYRHVPQFLGDDFERFYAIDQRGHGRSGGLRGYAPTFETLTADLKRVVTTLVEREKGKRFFLLAHSFGGLVALHYLLKERAVPFEGAIISAPLLGVALKVPGYKKALGELLGRTLSKVQLTNEVNPSHLSHDPHVIEAYVNDRLVHAKLTPRLYVDMTAAMDWVRAQTGPLACPALFVLPCEDLIVSTPTTIEFYRNLKFRDKDLREYPGMYHEAMNELGKEKVFEDIHKWLAPRLNN